MKVLLPLLLSGLSAYAQFPRVYGSRPFSVGCPTLVSDEFSTVNNQGTLGFVERNGIASGFSSRFALSELNETVVSSVLRTRRGIWGVSLGRLGYAKFSENFGLVAFGMKLSQAVSVGIGFRYLGLHIQDYGSRNKLLAEIGTLIKANSKLSLSSHVYNLLRSKIESGLSQSLPMTFRTGASYQLDPKTGLYSEITVPLTGDRRLNTGIIYRPTEKVSIQFSAATNPTEIRMGSGVQSKKLLIDLHMGYNPDLGISPGISITLRK